MEERWCIINYKNIKDDKYAISTYGAVKNIQTGKLLHPWKGNNGYRYATLMLKDNTPYPFGVHVLVAYHFIDIPDRLKNIDEPIVPNHVDFNRENNIVSNLVWMTYAENNEWNRINGHCLTCDEAPNSKVKNELVYKICELMEKGYKNKDIMLQLDLDPLDDYNKHLLTRIRTGKQWKDISSQFNITNKNTLRMGDTSIVYSICEYLDKGYKTKQMRALLGIPDDNESKKKFKNLVTGIRLRRNYKEISEKYNWWK